MGFMEWTQATIQMFLKGVAKDFVDLQKAPELSFDGTGIPERNISTLYRCRHYEELPTSPLYELKKQLANNKTQFEILQAEVLGKHYNKLMKTPEEGGVYKPTSESGIIIKSLMSEVQKIFGRDMREAQQMVEEENTMDEDNYMVVEEPKTEAEMPKSAIIEDKELPQTPDKDKISPIIEDRRDSIEGKKDIVKPKDEEEEYAGD